MRGESWLIVGLGNPGHDYRENRHNAGFMVIDKLAVKIGTTVRREECRSLIGRAKFGDVLCELAKPQTFMNLSGESVSCLLKKPSRSAERLLVISDDIAIPFGTLRLRSKGSHGGQNGLRSIIDRLGTNEFIRLRIGIGPDHPIRDTSKFVLENFSQSEMSSLDVILERASETVRIAVSDGIDAAMRRANGDTAP